MNLEVTTDSIRVYYGRNNDESWVAKLNLSQALKTIVLVDSSSANGLQ